MVFCIFHIFTNEQMLEIYNKQLFWFYIKRTGSIYPLDFFFFFFCQRMMRTINSAAIHHWNNR